MTSWDDRKRTRSADAQDMHHPKQKKSATAAVEAPDPANPYAPSPASVLECFRLLVEREGNLQPSSDFIMAPSPPPSLMVPPCIPNGRLMAMHCRDFLFLPCPRIVFLFVSK